MRRKPCRKSYKEDLERAREIRIGIFTKCTVGRVKFFTLRRLARLKVDLEKISWIYQSSVYTALLYSKKIWLVWLFRTRQISIKD